MRSVKDIFRTSIAVALMLLLTLPAMAQEQQRSASSTPSAGLEEALPDSPQPAEQTQQPPPPQSAQQQDNSRKPVGTAAAPYERTMGIAASRPAGAAIAPAKQRRVRTILISLGVIAGAGIAVGSVAALSHGSPSHP